MNSSCIKHAKSTKNGTAPFGYQQKFYVAPETFKCVSCGDDTPTAKGKQDFDSVTGRSQFFCPDCHKGSDRAFKANKRELNEQHETEEEF